MAFISASANVRSEEPEAKRQQSDDVTEQSVEKNGVEELKRDREHASVLVQNIPQNVTETQIRPMLSKCGIVKHLKLLQDDENSVVVEFEDSDAANFALSRNGVEFEGAELSIVLNTGSTLFVTNYPATADDAYIRNLFREYGEINVRFPSLLRNKKRRFCYVEFKRPSDAQSATEINGKDVDGLALEVKISNPAARQERKESTNLGRQVFVGQLSFKAKGDEVENLFSKYGTIEVIKIPQDNHPTRNRGIAFLTFSTPEEAQAALVTNGEELEGSENPVKLISDQVNRSTRTLNGRSKSPSLQPDAFVHKGLNPEQLAVGKEPWRSQTFDTVNQTRVRAAGEGGRVRKVMKRVTKAP